MPLLIDRDSAHLFYHTESVACRSQGSLLGSIAAGFSGGFRRVELPNPDANLPDLTSAWLLLLQSQQRRSLLRMLKENIHASVLVASWSLEKKVDS